VADDGSGWEGPTAEQDAVLDARHSFEGYVRNEPYGHETWARNAQGEDYRIPPDQRELHGLYPERSAGRELTRED
jgi:hypothetical protein